MREDVIRPLPPAPSSLWRIVGPGVVASGVGLSSGEFVLWPYIASQVGLVFLWGAVLGVITQFFINMEIERYTLATGETALAAGVAHTGRFPDALGFSLLMGAIAFGGGGRRAKPLPEQLDP